jgi:hypothetical protein
LLLILVLVFLKYLYDFVKILISKIEFITNNLSGSSYFSLVNQISSLFNLLKTQNLNQMNQVGSKSLTNERNLRNKELKKKPINAQNSQILSNDILNNHLKSFIDSF